MASSQNQGNIGTSGGYMQQTGFSDAKVNPLSKTVGEGILNQKLLQPNVESAANYQSWDVEETLIWANSEQLPYPFLDILIEKKIDGTSIHIGI